MTAVAFWRRLDVPGHDAARLTQTEAGWMLNGCAVFLHGYEPACLNYCLELNAVWETGAARINGFLGENLINQVIRRDDDGWVLNDRRIEGLAHLVDLDLGFTPATNLQQLRRVRPNIGDLVEIPVAWLDAGASTLIELPQLYERRDHNTYWYRAPSVGYEALLEIGESGFIDLYPRLWEKEAR